MNQGAFIEVNPMRNSTLQYLFSRKNEIEMDPVYQRQSAVWSLDKQQLLLDSLINGFDVPTVYLHQFNTPHVVDGRTMRWAVIDGKQRLEAIFRFFNNEFALSREFSRINDGSTAAAGKTYADLTSLDPLMISDLQSTSLDVKTIRTDDLNLIEDMFSRLNEAVPLNAAEKRNAFGGPLPSATKELAGHEFFTRKLPFGNDRYRHLDLSAKFLWLVTQDVAQKGESDGRGGSSVKDVKKSRLDSFFKDMKERSDGAAFTTVLKGRASKILDALNGVFVDDDPLLRTVGMVTVYYLLGRERLAMGHVMPLRHNLAEFDVARQTPPNIEESNYDKSDFVFNEFQRLAQSPNDGAALAYRLAVLDGWLAAKEEGSDPRKAMHAIYERDAYRFGDE